MFRGLNVKELFLRTQVEGKKAHQQRQQTSDKAIRPKWQE